MTYFSAARQPGPTATELRQRALTQSNGHVVETSEETLIRVAKEMGLLDEKQEDEA